MNEILLYLNEDPKATSRYITIQVTDDCNLNCSYCYQINKSNNYMTNSTMKSCIDLCFKLYELDNWENIINKHTKYIHFDFIGGEPLLNIDVIYFGTEYFIEQCIKKRHPWLTNFSINISTNGILFFNKKVQEYLNKFGDFVDFSITIDGPEKVHNLCRKNKECKGSFSQAFSAFQQYWKTTTKTPYTRITVTKDTLPYLNETYDFFYNFGCKTMLGGLISEYKWTVKEAQIYYQELKRIADKQLFKQQKMKTSFFHNIEELNGNLIEKKLCGGIGQIITFAPDGLAYPCLRYTKSSLGEKLIPPYIGDCNQLYSSISQRKIFVNKLQNINNECISCPIGKSCDFCAAELFKNQGKRNINLCWIHRAEYLANIYYWKNFYKINKINKEINLTLNKNICLQIISENEYNILLNL